MEKWPTLSKFLVNVVTLHAILIAAQAFGEIGALARHCESSKRV
jgi:hypothetical protein